MAISDAYTKSFIQPRNALLMEMEQFAEENYVPIMQLPAIEILLQMLRIQNPATILEIGSAIGYSAIRMAETVKDAKIVTIERDETRIEQAKQFLSKSDVKDHIVLLEGDALEVDVESTYPSFDAVFIDAAKGQYKKFFEKYSPLVKKGGILYIDNMYMHGLSDLDMKDVPKRKRTMIRNLHQFAEWIIANPDYQSSFFPVGDGLLICIKR
ncbi:MULTISPECIES: O-methyltransferase [unclassified Rummeliibacillus]|uniref:O-methyltransferase n=1 Tax=unclassified Rummeliibacillus TaxID=2622809 RepID=UPI000E6758FB|nr:MULTISPECIES: O-methyltransferase [unclassified Rummeliibacillus]RIJ67528.1 O-methyltransferase [Rummeliibacillus sp. POC4]RPJ97088.1 O-methyltransferase [Rummeliibacillus sp. TYF005]